MAPMVSPNFEESSIVPGTYGVRVKSCQQKTSQSGNPYLSWVLVVDGGPYNGSWIYHNTPFSGRGATMFKDFVRAAYDPNYDSGPIDTDLLINCALQVEIERGLNQDGTESKYMKVIEVAPAPSDQNFNDSDIPF